MVGTLIAGGLLNADQLAKTAEAQSPGLKRTVCCPLPAISWSMSAMLCFLNGPRDFLARSLGSDSAATRNEERFHTQRCLQAYGTGPGRRVGPLETRSSRTIGAAIVNAASETEVFEARFDVQYSSGLARPELYDWNRELAESLAAQPPDVLVFMIGANDGQALETASGFVEFGSQVWLDAYGSRVGNLMDLFARQNRRHLLDRVTGRG